MGTTDHQVQDGETLPKIASANGFRRWESIWEEGGNAALREKRESPWVLHPGDVVKIPDARRKEEACATEQHHVFKAPILKERLRLKVEASRGNPMSGKDYTLKVDGKEYTGVTSADGVIEQDVPVESSSGELEIEGCVWPLQIGYLNPVAEEAADDGISGAQSRLNNLGYAAGEVTGSMNESTRAAIKAFQADEGFDAARQTGELDDDTAQKLRDRHGA